MRRRVRFIYGVILFSGLVMSALILAARFGDTVVMLGARNLETFAGEISEFKAQDARAGFRADAVLFVGSSSLKRWQDIDTRFAPRPVINRGFGGAQMRHVLHHYDDVISVYKPNVLVIYAGGNDLAAGVKPGVVLKDFDLLMENVRRDFPDLPVLIVSIKPVPARMEDIDAQKIVNDGFMQRAKVQTNLHYVDIATPMLTLMQDDVTGQGAGLFKPDGLHMTAKGYDIWAAELNWYLDRLLGRVESGVMDRG